MHSQPLELRHSLPASELLTEVAKIAGMDITVVTPVVRCTQCGRVFGHGEEVDLVAESGGEQARFMCHRCYMHSLIHYVGPMMRDWLDNVI